ncbi:putative nitrate ABC transporter (permease protein) (ntrB-like protein) [Bradyrhizobium sp. ORS 285]|uniref:nitrate ABC transporter permease n=1 Tax=Bradyrhizobium sp. ORS 285 TaxID=115808 RepID=UPI0002408A57|nr:nitrate ABC transporter permease [Bradyrhizobium sp. ORS 285]CCD89163.1 putative nitrate ABC transporter (permease protein) (ntrB-like protein) [Bradyrhizobium sp. ORS 285]SMX59418.1 putative nitrate ABC transporter (permease protein) (ntrB-like protein) [Bradyrhizobium sp. ORS 285]
MTTSLRLRAAVVSIVLLAVFLGAWHIATRSTGTAANMSPEYAKLMGMTATQGKSAMPGPLAVGAKLWEHLRRPFYDNGPNDKGLGIQLAFSLGRVMLGYLIAVALAIPLGFLIGMSPLMSKALDPFIQILKPISPLAWMPLALYTIKDSSLSAIFVIFICSVWPMLINTAFGVASVRKEWINVARTLEVGNFRRAFTVILPAAAPTILTGMRISIGIAWLVIVAAEMLVGGTGIGYFVWNEWNNLSITNVIIAILLIGAVGMVLDQLLARVSWLVTFPE